MHVRTDNWISIAVFLISTVSAYGGTIVIDDHIYEQHNIGATQPYTASTNQLAGFDPSGSAKLVLITSLRPNFGSARTFGSVTYGGVEMTKVIEQKSDGDFLTTGIFYLDNPGPLAPIVVNASGNLYDGMGLCLLALSGTKEGVGSSNSSTSTTTSVTTDLNKSFVVAGSGDQGAALAPLTPLYDQATVGVGYQLVSAPTTVNPSFTDSGSYRVTVAAVFPPLPPKGTVISLK
jgi:hypothetical protein